MSVVSREFLYEIAETEETIELDYLSSAIGSMQLRTIEIFTVTAATENRIDLISFKYYGTYNLGWLIAFHNDMIDPVNETVAGKRINIPSLDDYYRFYNRNSRVI